MHEGLLTIAESQTFASWNHIGEWLRRVDALRLAP
jgi:hypothetical protein